MPARMLVMALLAALLSTAAVSAQTPPPYEPMPSITVLGRGEAQGQPDTAVLTIGVLAEAPVAADALAGNTAAMTRLRRALEQHQIAEGDINTVQFEIMPLHQYDAALPQEPQIIGYWVSNLVRVRLRELTELRPLLDTLLHQEGTHVQSIDYVVDDPQDYRYLSSQRALSDARQKAELYAASAGAALGQPLQIREQAGASPEQAGPYPVRTPEVEHGPPAVPGEMIFVTQVAITYQLVYPEE